jgi:hypothetical protein
MKVTVKNNRTPFRLNELPTGTLVTLRSDLSPPYHIVTNQYSSEINAFVLKCELTNYRIVVCTNGAIISYRADQPLFYIVDAELIVNN